jgi:hypothetical protein
MNQNAEGWNQEKRIKEKKVLKNKAPVKQVRLSKPASRIIQ